MKSVERLLADLYIVSEDAVDIIKDSTKPLRDEVVEMSDDVIEEESSSYENDREELFCSYERNRISG